MNVKAVWNGMMNNLEEKSPRIKVAVGVAGLVGAAIGACVASTKLKEEIKEETKAYEDIRKIRNAQKAEEKGETLPEEEVVSKDVTFTYTDKDFSKDILRVTRNLAKKLVKLYGIPFVVAVASIYLIFNGTSVLNSRYLAMSASYSTVVKAFDMYRERVKERYGEEVEQDIYYGTRTEKVEVEEVDEESGEVKKVKKNVKVSDDPTACSPYAFIFDERFGEYVNDINMCEKLASAWQSLMNEELKRKRYLVLNDLYDKFSAPDEMYTADSMIIGWRSKKDETNDARIDFRIQRIFITDENGRRVPRILIDPNVEGDIYKKVTKDLGYVA